MFFSLPGSRGQKGTGSPTRNTDLNADPYPGSQTNADPCQGRRSPLITAPAVNINLSKNSKWPKRVTEGGRGKRIHEKTWGVKSRVRLPLSRNEFARKEFEQTYKKWVNCTWEAGVARHGCGSAALHHVALVVPEVSLVAAMLTTRPSSPLSNHRVGISHHHQPCAARAAIPSAVITVGRPELRLRPGGGAAQQTGRIVGAVAGQPAQSHQLMMAACKPIAVLLLLFLALFPGFFRVF